MAGPIGYGNTEALRKLGLEDSGEHLPPGGGTKLKVTEETVKKVQESVGKTILVKDSGEIEVSEGD